MNKNISLKFRDNILLIYGVCIFLYAILQSNLSTQYPFLKKIILGSFLILMFLGVFINIKYRGKIREKDAIVMSIFFVLLVYNILNNGYENGTLLIIPFCYLLIECNIDEILKKYCTFTFLGIAFVVILSQIGILDNQTFSNAATTYKMRQGLGFIWATFGPNMFLSATLAFISYKKENINFIQIFVLFIVNIFFYTKTKTLAVFICMILCLTATLFCKNIKIRNFLFSNRLLIFLFSNFSIITATFTILFQIYYNLNVNNSVMLNALNRAMSFRLGLGQEAFKNYKITLFGQMMAWNQGTTKNYFYLDSSYLSVLFNNGVVMLVFICILMNIVCTYGVKTKNYFLVIALSIFLIHCITDPQLIDFRNNPFLMVVLQAYFYLRQTRKIEINDNIVRENVK